jgi:hypothetical protein
MGGWRKLRNEELRDLYSSPNILRITKSRRLRWARYVAQLVKRNVYGFLGKSEGNRNRVLVNAVMNFGVP